MLHLPLNPTIGGGLLSSSGDCCCGRRIAAASLEKTKRRKSIISEHLWELCVTSVTFVTNERRLLWNNAPSIEFSYTILRHLWHLWHNTADIHDKAGPPWEKYQFCFSRPLFTVTISFSFIFETNSMELLCDFFHPTCSGSGCSVSIAFETTYFLLHSLLNPTIESGPPSSSGDCRAKLSTAVFATFTASLIMSLRKALRTPQICKNGGLQILAEFCDKAAVPRQHTPCGNKKPDPWENKITEKINFVFHDPHLL